MSPCFRFHRSVWSPARAGLRTAAAVAAAAFALAAPAGCARIDPDGPRFQVTEEDGVPVAETINGPLHADPIFRVEELLVLTEDPTRPESMLFSPRSFTVGPDGCYYVIDAGNRRIAVYGADGTYLRSFGREGGGPGEFRLMELLWLAGDTLSIFDYTQLRTTHFRTDGTLLEVLTSPVGGYALSLDRTPGGIWLQKGIRPQQHNDIGSDEYRIVCISSTGRDTLAVVRTRLVTCQYRKVQEAPQGGTLVFGRAMPYAGAPTIGWYPGRGILRCDGDRSELYWYDTRGRLSRIIRPGIPSGIVTAEMRNDFLDREREQAEAYTNRAGRNPLPAESYPFPDTVGFCRWLTVDDRGFIWCLDVFDQDRHVDGEGWLFHVIDPEGRWLGTTRLPTGRPTIAGGRIMALLTDPETDEVRPTVYRITPAVEGLVYP